jgi:hypothetical protein
MAENSDSNGGLYFVVGALVLAVAGFGYYYFNGSPVVHTDTHTTIIEKTVAPPVTLPDIKIEIDKK